MQQHKQVPRMNSFIYFTSQIHRTLIKMLHESAPPPPHPPLPQLLLISFTVTSRSWSFLEGLFHSFTTAQNEFCIRPCPDEFIIATIVTFFPYKNIWALL